MPAAKFASSRDDQSGLLGWRDIVYEEQVDLSGTEYGWLLERAGRLLAAVRTAARCRHGNTICEIETGDRAVAVLVTLQWRTHCTCLQVRQGLALAWAIGMP